MWQDSLNGQVLLMARNSSSLVIDSLHDQEKNLDIALADLLSQPEQTTTNPTGVLFSTSW